MSIKKVISSVLILTFLTVCIASGYDFVCYLDPDEATTDDVSGIYSTNDCRLSIDATDVTGSECVFGIDVTVPGVGIVVEHLFYDDGSSDYWIDDDVQLTGGEVRAYFIDNMIDATGTAIVKLKWPY